MQGRSGDATKERIRARSPGWCVLSSACRLRREGPRRLTKVAPRGRLAVRPQLEVAQAPHRLPNRAMAGQPQLFRAVLSLSHQLFHGCAPLETAFTAPRIPSAACGGDCLPQRGGCQYRELFPPQTPSKLVFPALSPSAPACVRGSDRLLPGAFVVLGPSDPSPPPRFGFRAGRTLKLYSPLEAAPIGRTAPASSAAAL